MTNIYKWLKTYQANWEQKNIDGVLSLFTKDVIYGNINSPNKKLDDIKIEWQSIKRQKDIYLKFELFSHQENKYTVIWELRYTNPEYKTVSLKGIYLMKLGEEEKCNYFVYSGE